MSSRIFSATTVAVVLSAAALLSPASAQQKKPQFYAFHSYPVVGGCPGLDWHITLEPNDTLQGFVAWDRGQHMARLDGKLNKDRTFLMNAQEVGGKERKAVVKGTAGGQYINAQINGSGTACDDVNLAIPRLDGGLEGGGG